MLNSECGPCSHNEIDSLLVFDLFFGILLLLMLFWMMVASYFEAGSSYSSQGTTGHCLDQHVCLTFPPWIARLRSPNQVLVTASCPVSFSPVIVS